MSGGARRDKTGLPDVLVSSSDWAGSRGAEQICLLVPGFTRCEREAVGEAGFFFLKKNLHVGPTW